MIACELILGSGCKRELLLKSPLLPACGALGSVVPDDVWAYRHLLGAFITPPLTWEPVAPSDQPRILPCVSGFLLGIPQPGPGLRGAVRRYAHRWQSWGLPILVGLCPADLDDTQRMAAVLATRAWVQGVELHPGEAMASSALVASVQILREELGLPCLVRVRFDQGPTMAALAQDAGADGLVIAAPPTGRLLADEGTWMAGDLHSPALAPVYAQRVHQVAREVQLPIIARGGIASIRDVLSMLAAGAAAVQLDTILWVHPTALREIAEALEQEMAVRGAAQWLDMLASCRRERPESLQM